MCNDAGCRVWGVGCRVEGVGLGASDGSSARFSAETRPNVTCFPREVDGCVPRTTSVKSGCYVSWSGPPRADFRI